MILNCVREAPLSNTSVLFLSAAVLAIQSHSAAAQGISEEQAAALLDRLNQLEAEVKSLRAQLGNVQTSQASQAETVAAVEKQVAATEEKVAAAGSEKVTWKGAPQISTSSGWSFKPRGRLQYDAGTVNAPGSIVDNGLGFASEIRRARLGVQGDIPGGFGYKFEVDFADNEVVVTDAVLTYKDGPAKFTVGQHNNFQSFEELTSSLHISFLERAAFTDAFGFQRRVGASAEFKSGDFLAQGGVFTSNFDDLSSDEANALSLDGRVVFMPKTGDTQWHLGGSVHWRDLNDQSGDMRYRQRPAIHTTDTRFINTGNFTVTEETSYGLEAAVLSGPLHIAGEAHWLKATRPGGLANPTFFGGYVEAGYFFTKGDKRGYKSGKFDRVKPNASVGDGGAGALQANVRFDYLDLSDAGIIGGTQNAYQASLIWTPADYVRFMLNYSHIEYDNAAISAASGNNYTVDVIGARAQVDF